MFVNRLVVDIILHLNVLENKLPSKSKLVQSKCGCEFTDVASTIFENIEQPWTVLIHQYLHYIHCLAILEFIHHLNMDRIMPVTHSHIHLSLMPYLHIHTHISTGNQRFQQFTLNKNRMNILPLVYHPRYCFTRFMAMLILVDYQFWWISRLSKNMTPFFYV